MKLPRNLFFLFACLLMVGEAEAKKKPFQWNPVTDEDWAITRDSSRQIFDAVVIFEKVLADDLKMQKGDLYRTLYRRIRILGPSGRSWADVDVPYMHLSQKIKDVNARCIQPDGTITELTEDNVFEKRVVKTKDEKLEQTTFSIPGVSDDCIIEYAITYEVPSSLSVWIVQKDIPVLKAEYRWVLGELKLTAWEADILQKFVTPNYLWLNTHSKPKVTELPNIKDPETLFFEIGYIPPYEELPYSIPEAAQQTKLYCYYGSDLPPQSYWGERASDNNDGLTEFCEKNKRVKSLVGRWEGLEDDKAKIAAAYRWVQDSILNLTYLDLLDEKGKEQEPREIKSVDDVLKYRYGSRLDIDCLFCDILREMNIKAKIVYLKDRMNDLFVAEAKYWQMNRSLVSVENADGTLGFYSPGHPCTPVDIVPWFCEGVDALICGSTEYLQPVPFSDWSKTVSNLAYQLSFGEDLEVSGVLKARLTGHDARSMRVKLLDEDSTDFRDLLKEELSGYVPQAEIDSVEFEPTEDIAQPFRVSCRVEYPAASQVGSRIILKPFEYASESANPFTEPQRSAPVLFDYAFRLNESMQITLPEGYEIEALPRDTLFENPVGKCAVQFQLVGNTLSAQRIFTITAPFWSAQNYELIQRLFQTQADLSGQIVFLTEASESAGGEQ
ncbi:MAG: DUF3857 domain-containing protein [Candidatus Zixiibacteriota bacterium]